MKAKNKGNEDMNRAMQLTFIAVIFFWFAAIVSAPCVAQTPTPTSTATPLQAQTLIPSDMFSKNVVAIGAAIGAIFVILIAFAILVYVGVRGGNNLDKGGLRRAIAGTFVVGFSILAILSFVFGILREHIITAYIELVGIVIGFYFGQRSAATQQSD